MVNAKEELLLLLKSRGLNVSNIEAYNVHFKCESLKGTDPEELLSFLNKEYDSGFGCQELEGTVLLNNGTWLERGEYDGSEWWDYMVRPTVEDLLEEKPNRA